MVDLASKYRRNSNNWPLHCDRTLELPLLVRSEFFSFLSVSGGRFLVCFFAPFPREEISDYIAHGPIIRVFTVLG